ncbi:hypothetical protein [Polynucleobacter sp. MG-28-Ekke-A2]|uniref:hypothetical protein n=1 Tax=Polynucleobacter sp. MG-28-Ekke-A2 TaxID=3108276 RepID=UPI002B22DF66|nr:hypothetical protein [Polynucleobacter sp. MG-28-Ekke-A2]
MTPEFLDSIDLFLKSRSIHGLFELSKIFYDLSDEKLFQLKTSIQIKLGRRYVHHFSPQDLVKYSFTPGMYRKGVIQFGGLLDFLVNLLHKSSGHRVIFLGEDGFEYLAPTFHILSEGAIPFSTYPISRKHLATRVELIDLGVKFLTSPAEESSSIEDLLRGEGLVEKMTKLNRNSREANNFFKNSIKLYQDMDDAIATAILEVGAHKYSLDSSEFIFGDRLSQSFNLLISNPDHLDVLIGLIADLLSEINFDNTSPLIIVDYAGIGHVQAHVLQLFLNWLGDPQNWLSLSHSQQLALRVSCDFFAHLNVKLHIGVSRGNPLHKIKGAEVFINSQSVDIVETTRFWGFSDADLADGKLSIGVFNSFHISETLAKIAIISEEAYKIKHS